MQFAVSLLGLCRAVGGCSGVSGVSGHDAYPKLLAIVVVSLIRHACLNKLATVVASSAASPYWLGRELEINSKRGKARGGEIQVAARQLASQ